MSHTLEQQEECFHLGMKALILNEEGKILLLEKHPQNKAGRHWDIPGGRIQKNEAFEEALKREVYEETSLQHLTDLRFFTMVMTERRITTPLGSVKLALMVYFCNVKQRAPIRLSDEHIRFDWVDPKDVRELLSPSFFPEDLIEKISSLSKFVNLREKASI
jgi:8-oxo-dGTP diphosphatase